MLLEMPQSQEHGFIIENFIRKNVFLLEPIANDINIHDIPCDKNRFNSNEDVSIKCTGSNKIECGDIQRFYSYDFSEKNTIIVIQYSQNTDTTKIIKRIYEIDYNQELHKLLFGEITIEKINEYVQFIKSIPSGREARDQCEAEYKKRKKELQNFHKMTTIIHPKVDSKSQRRVQCSFDISKIPKKFITYTSTDKNPNLLRGIEIPLTIESSRRKRGGITLDKLKDICRKNKDVCKGFSKHRKESLINFLKERNLGHIIKLYTHL